jgi:hypothetical protein
MVLFQMKTYDKNAQNQNLQYHNCVSINNDRVLDMAPSKTFDITIVYPWIMTMYLLLDMVSWKSYFVLMKYIYKSIELQNWCIPFHPRSIIRNSNGFPLMSTLVHLRFLVRFRVLLLVLAFCVVCVWFFFCYCSVVFNALWVVSLVLNVSLDCPLLIASSVFSNVYWLNLNYKCSKNLS